MNVEALIPHRPPMRWIDRLVECTETTARAEVSCGPDHFAVAGGFVRETALIECMAQTAAAALGERARARGGTEQPAAGMLAAIANFRVTGSAPAGKMLEVEVRELKRFGPMLLIAGTVTGDQGVIATGELTLYA
jgi:predicted hotdog family 3-hydroxylacyl-ACP dehydratase